MKAIVFLFSVLLFGTSASAQPEGDPVRPMSISFGKMIDWYSPAVQDSFRTYIFLPPGYDTSSVAYPVLYLTDGDWVFTTAVSALGNLKQDYKVQEPIIIAIGYGSRENKRSRDLDPDQGGAAFLRALKEELMPWAKQRLKVQDKPLLYGYSMGGKFATFALFSEPQLFSSVMIGAPADNGTHLLPTAKKFSAHLSTIRAKVFMSAGSYEHETVDHIEMFRLWCKANVPGVSITTYTAPKMNHGAAISAVLQEALRVNFATLQKEIVLPASRLQQYTGVYTSKTDAKVQNKVFVRNNQLYIVLHGYAKDYALQLHPVSANTFFLKEYEQSTYTFSPTGLVIRLGNGNILEMKKRISLSK